jgi:membrane protease YdiL (CAAX protease family)
MDLSAYGLTRKYIRQSLVHSALITAAGLAAITLLGFYTSSWGMRDLGLVYAFYYIFLSAPLQELFFRGLVQTRMERVLSPWVAVMVASVFFGAVHFYNPVLAGLTFAAGLAWGWSFHKRRNLAGPAVSHSVLGLYLFMFVL